MSQRLLFITPVIDEQHDDLAFAALWARAFADAGFSVTVIAARVGKHSLPFPVFSLGAEDGASSAVLLARFTRRIVSLKYDRVFVHMNPRWLAAGLWWWLPRRMPLYLWYTHYTMPLSLKISTPFVKHFFCATPDSLPQFAKDSRKIVTGHGIDLAFWEVLSLPDSEREPATHLLAVHRLSRSKRIDIVLRALALLPKEYTLTHYGRPLDPRDDAAYAEEVRALAESPELKGRVRFMGSVPMPALRAIYPRFQTLVSMVPDTIDKTVLEAMYCGVTPVITPGHAAAIGFPSAPDAETPEALARYITSHHPLPREELRHIVRQKHSLAALIEKMATFIREGK